MLRRKKPKEKPAAPVLPLPATFAAARTRNFEMRFDLPVSGTGEFMTFTINFSIGTAIAEFQQEAIDQLDLMTQVLTDYGFKVEFKERV